MPLAQRDLPGRPAPAAGALVRRRRDRRRRPGALPRQHARADERAAICSRSGPRCGSARRACARWRRGAARRALARAMAALQDYSERADARDAARAAARAPIARATCSTTTGSAPSGIRRSPSPSRSAAAARASTSPARRRRPAGRVNANLRRDAVGRPLRVHARWPARSIPPNDGTRAPARRSSRPRDRW